MPSEAGGAIASVEVHHRLRRRRWEIIKLRNVESDDPSKVEEACRIAGSPMPGLEIETLDVRMDKRGW